MFFNKNYKSEFKRNYTIVLNLYRLWKKLYKTNYIKLQVYSISAYITLVSHTKNQLSIEKLW